MSMAGSPAKTEHVVPALPSNRALHKGKVPSAFGKLLEEAFAKEMKRVPIKAINDSPQIDEFWSPAVIAKESFQSRMIELAMGVDGQGLFVNELALRPYLQNTKLLHEDFKEVQERVIKLPEHDLDTGARFLQWIYTKDYDAPKPYLIQGNVEDTTKDASGDTATAAHDDTEAVRDPDEHAKAVQEVRTSLSRETSKHSDSSISNCDRFIRWAPANFHLMQDLRHLEAFLAHAKLYVLADYLQIPDLQRLASKRLRLHVLSVGYSKITEVASGDVAQLAAYIYEHTNDHEPGHLEEEEQLRKHISDFIARHFDLFGGETFGAVMSKGGDLVTDVWQKVQAGYKKLRQANTDLKRKAEDSLPAPTAPKRSKSIKSGAK